MSRTDRVQFNVRSAFARSRAHELAKLTGMTVVQVVEEALRGFVPPSTDLKVVRLVQRGPIMVWAGGGTKISLAEADAALNEVRERDLED